MSVAPGPEFKKIAEEAHKDKLRKQVHHDLCVLSAGGANVKGLKETADNALSLYNKLWHQVLKVIP